MSTLSAMLASLAGPAAMSGPQNQPIPNPYDPRLVSIGGKDDNYNPVISNPASGRPGISAAPTSPLVQQLQPQTPVVPERGMSPDELNAWQAARQRGEDVSDVGAFIRRMRGR